jgi:thermostable 8-oxoguanine DNA glycosylase
MSGYTGEVDMSVNEVIAGWVQWKVSAYTGKNRDINLGSTFVQADTEDAAKELGRSALRMIGVRGRYMVEARPYFPWKDIAFIGYVARSSNGTSALREA